MNVVLAHQDDRRMPSFVSSIHENDWWHCAEQKLVSDSAMVCRHEAFYKLVQMAGYTRKVRDHAMFHGQYPQGLQQAVVGRHSKLLIDAILHLAQDVMEGKTPSTPVIPWSECQDTDNRIKLMMGLLQNEVVMCRNWFKYESDFSSAASITDSSTNIYEASKHVEVPATRSNDSLEQEVIKISDGNDKDEVSELNEWQDSEEDVDYAEEFSDCEIEWEEFENITAPDSPQFSKEFLVLTNDPNLVEQMETISPSLWSEKDERDLLTEVGRHCYGTCGEKSGACRRVCSEYPGNMDPSKQGVDTEEEKPLYVQPPSPDLESIDF